MSSSTGDRFPPLKREDVTPEQQPLWDKMDSVATAAFGSPEESPFTWKLSNGALVMGPMNSMFPYPKVADANLDLIKAIAEIPGLPADAREVAIVTTGCHFQAAFELYSHKALLEKQGLSKAQVEAIGRGEKPEGLNEKCEVAFDVATVLHTKPGPLSNEMWERSLKVLGRDGTMGLVHYVGVYSYVCVVLNAMDLRVPAEAK